MSAALPQTGVAPDAAGPLRGEARHRRAATRTVPGGRRGGAGAIYTEHGAVIHIIRKVILRVGTEHELAGPEAALSARCMPTMHRRRRSLVGVGCRAVCAADVCRPRGRDTRRKTRSTTSLPADAGAGARRAGPSRTTGSRRSTIARSTRSSPRRWPHNPDLRVAAARVEQAAGYVQACAAARSARRQPARHGRRRHVGGGGRPARCLAQRAVGARPLGPPRLCPRTPRRRQSSPGRRTRVRAPVDRGAGGQELVPGRSRPAAAAAAERWSRPPSAARPLRRNACASASATSRRSPRLAQRATSTATALRQLDLRARAGAARARAAARPLSGRAELRRPELAGCRAGAGRPAVGVAGAPSRRHRRRAPRGRRVQSRRRGAGRAAAAHHADARHCRSDQRPVRAAGPRQPVGARVAQLVAPLYHGRRAAMRRSRSAPPNRRRRWRSTRRRHACLRRGRECALRRRSRCTSARRSSTGGGRQRARAGTGATRYRVGAGDLRAVEQQQPATLSAHRAPAARAKRQRWSSASISIWRWAAVSPLTPTTIHREQREAAPQAALDAGLRADRVRARACHGWSAPGCSWSPRSRSFRSRG